MSVSDLFHDAFYRFVTIQNPEALITELELLCSSSGVLGSILVAGEGINGMLCGTTSQLQTVRDGLEADPRFQNLMYKRTRCRDQVFKKMKVKLKPEIVALGIEGVDASKYHGTDVSPHFWRELIRRDDVVLIDNRNEFEYTLGHFKNAINPGVDNFRDFAKFIESNLETWQDKTISMYCTGGIRCEKTSAWLAEKGIQIMQLEGGILNYFQEVKDANLDYEGTCFVFDKRQELDTNLKIARTPRTPEVAGLFSRFLWDGMEPDVEDETENVTKVETSMLDSTTEQPKNPKALTGIEHCEITALKSGGFDPVKAVRRIRDGK